jgi:hypothetical protein
MRSYKEFNEAKEHQISPEKWWNEVHKICKRYNVSPDSDEAYNAAMNTTIRDKHGVHWEVFTQESLRIFEAGLEGILSDKREGKR